MAVACGTPTPRTPRVVHACPGPTPTSTPSAPVRIRWSAVWYEAQPVAADTLKKAGRRPIPPQHQREVVDFCRELGIATAAFYVFGFVQDTWTSIAHTIDYAISLGSTPRV